MRRTVPLFERELVRAPAARDPCGGDNRVQAAEAVDCLRHAIANARLAADVAAHANGPRVDGLDLFDRVVQGLVTDIQDRHRGTLLREQPRTRAPDAAARSRDQRPPARQRAAHSGLSEMAPSGHAPTVTHISPELTSVHVGTQANFTATREELRDRIDRWVGALPVS